MLRDEEYDDGDYTYDENEGNNWISSRKTMQFLVKFIAYQLN